MGNLFNNPGSQLRAPGMGSPGGSGGNMWNGVGSIGQVLGQPSTMNQSQAYDQLNGASLFSSMPNFSNGSTGTQNQQQVTDALKQLGNALGQPRGFQSGGPVMEEQYPPTDRMTPEQRDMMVRAMRSIPPTIDAVPVRKEVRVIDRPPPPRYGPGPHFDTNMRFGGMVRGYEYGDIVSPEMTQSAYSGAGADSSGGGLLGGVLGGGGSSGPNPMDVANQQAMKAVQTNNDQYNEQVKDYQKQLAIEEERRRRMWGQLAKLGARTFNRLNQNRPYNPSDAIDDAVDYGRYGNRYGYAAGGPVLEHIPEPPPPPPEVRGVPQGPPIGYQMPAAYRAQAAALPAELKPISFPTYSPRSSLPADVNSSNAALGALGVRTDPGAEKLNFSQDYLNPLGALRKATPPPPPPQLAAAGYVPVDPNWALQFYGGGGDGGPGGTGGPGGATGPGEGAGVGGDGSGNLAHGGYIDFRQGGQPWDPNAAQQGLRDTVPAMLDHGEFVMTRDAVMGAGKGNLRRGATKMRTMMSAFENRATKDKKAFS